MKLVLKLFGIGIASILLEEMLGAQGGKEYGHYVKIASIIICIGLTFSEISETVNTVMTMFNLN